MTGSWERWRSAASNAARTLPVGVDPADQLAQHARGVLVAHLARTRRLVAAAAVLEHQLAHVGLGAAVEDRLAGGEHRVLLAQAPEGVDRDVALRIQRVQRE